MVRAGLEHDIEPEPPPVARIDNIQTDSKGSPRRDLTHAAKLEGIDKPVDALMDTGAFYTISQLL